MLLRHLPPELAPHLLIVPSHTVSFLRCSLVLQCGNVLYPRPRQQHEVPRCQYLPLASCRHKRTAEEDQLAAQQLLQPVTGPEHVMLPTGRGCSQHV